MTGIPKVLFSTTTKRGHKVRLQTCFEKQKNRCQSFKFIFSGACFEMLYLLALKWPQSKNSRMQRSAFTFRFARRIIWRANERCNWKKFWLRKSIPWFSTKPWWFTKGVAFNQKKDKLIAKTFSRKCAALSL